MKKTIKNAMSSLTAKLAALLFAFTCAGTAWGATVTTEAELRTAIANGGTVTLGADIALTQGEIAVSNTVTLDLGTYTISSPTNVFRVAANGNFTVNADATSPGGISTPTNRCCVYTSYGWDPGAKTVVLNGGVFTGNCVFNWAASALSAYVSYENYGLAVDGAGSGEKTVPTSVTINGGTFTGGYELGNVGAYRCYYFTVNGGTFEKGLDCADTRYCSIGVTTTCKAYFNGGHYRDRYPTFRKKKQGLSVVDDPGKVFIGTASHTNSYYIAGGYYVNAYDRSACEVTGTYAGAAVQSTYWVWLTTGFPQRWYNPSATWYFLTAEDAADVGASNVIYINGANGAGQQVQVSASPSAARTSASVVRLSSGTATLRAAKSAAAPARLMSASPARLTSSASSAADVITTRPAGTELGEIKVVDNDSHTYITQNADSLAGTEFKTELDADRIDACYFFGPTSSRYITANDGSDDAAAYAAIYERVLPAAMSFEEEPSAAMALSFTSAERQLLLDNAPSLALEDGAYTISQDCFSDNGDGSYAVNFESNDGLDGMILLYCIAGHSTLATSEANPFENDPHLTWTPTLVVSFDKAVAADSVRVWYATQGQQTVGDGHLRDSGIAVGALAANAELSLPLDAGLGAAYFDVFFVKGTGAPFPLIAAVQNKTRANIGTAVTVKLRVTNPNDSAEYADRASFTHVFAKDNTPEVSPVEGSFEEYDTSSGSNVHWGEYETAFANHYVDDNGVQIGTVYSSTRTALETAFNAIENVSETGLGNVTIAAAEGETQQKWVQIEWHGLVDIRDGEPMTTIAFGIAPQLRTITDSGSTVRAITNEELDGQTITFRLPLTDDYTARALVVHTSDDAANYPEERWIANVAGSAGARYVEISTTHFSEFTVSPIGADDIVYVTSAAGAFIGGYETLADAYAATEDGGTIYLLENVSEPLEVAAAKTFNINANGYAYSGAVTAAEGIALARSTSGTLTTYTATALPVVATVTANDVTTNFWDLHKALEAGKAAGSVVTLLADVDLAGVAWVPVGTAADKFHGAIDGNGKVISNLTVNDPTLDYAGLIGYGDGNQTNPYLIKDLTISNATITARSYAGALAGHIYAGYTVSNVTVKGLVQVTANYMVGGMVGKGYLRFRDCSIAGDEGSFVKGLYLGQNNETVGGVVLNDDYEGDNVGGMVGHLSEGSTLGCYNCSVSGLTILGSRKVGGIAGTTGPENHYENVDVRDITIGTTATAEYATAKKSSMEIGGIVGSYYDSGTGGVLSGTVQDVAIAELPTGVTGTGDSKNISYGLVSGGHCSNNPENYGITYTHLITKGYDAAIYNNDYFINNYKAKVTDANGDFVGYYDSIAAAVAASSTGYTITLVDDVDENVTLASWKNNALTIDLGGYTLTGQIIAPYGAKSEGIVIKNGSIVGRDSSSFYCLQFGYGSGNATLENLSVTQVSQNYRSFAVFFQQTSKTVTLRNVTLDGRFYTANSQSTIAIESGVYKNSTGLSSSEISNGGVVAAKGGTFYYDPTTPNTLVAKGYIAIETNDVNDVQCWVVELGPPFATVTFADSTVAEFWDLDEAIAVLAEGATLTIKPGTYDLANANYSLPKNVTLVGVEENGVRVKITSKPTFNSANGLTIQNIDFDGGYSWTPPAVTVHGDATFKNCTITGENAVYYSTVNGTLTFDGCTMTADTYALNVGEGTGDVIVKDCTISGWTSFGNTGKTVITGTKFEEGDYNYVRFYQDAVIDECTFNTNMKININTTGKSLIVSDSAFEDGSSIASVIGEGENDDPIANNYVAVGTNVQLDENGGIVGGIFEVIDDELIATGYLSVDNLESATAERYPLTVGGPFVAVIVDDNGKFVNGYTTLQAAFDEAETSGKKTEIVLVDDAVVAGTDNEFYVAYNWVADVVLDLNGHNVINTCTDGAYGQQHAIVNEGTLTIKDSQDDGTKGGCVYTMTVAQRGNHVIANSGTLTIEGGWFGDSDNDKANANDISVGQAVYNTGTAVINGGHFTAVDNNFTASPSRYAYVLCSDQEGATMTINDADVYGAMNGVISATSGGDVTINGGNFYLGRANATTYVYRLIYTTGTSVVEVNGGNWTANNSQNTGEEDFKGTGTSQILLNGGTFTLQNGFPYASEGACGVVVSGGNYSKVVPTYCAAAGYIPTTTPDENGKYTVTPDPAKVVRNATKNVAYATWADGFAALEAGETLQCLTNFTGLGAITLPAGATLDGNGLTLSGTSYLAVNAAGGTVKNVNFNAIGARNVTTPAITANDLAGALVVEGCTFANGVTGYNAETDVAVTTVADASVKIIGNTFTGKTEKNYVIVEGAAAYAAEITGNVFNAGGSSKRAFAVVNGGENVVASGNYVADGLYFGVSTNGVNGSELAYPQLASPTAATAEKAIPTFIVKNSPDGYPAIKGYAALADAFTDAGTGETILMTADATLDAAAVAASKSLVLDGQGFTLAASSDWSMKGAKAATSSPDGSVTLQNITLKYDAASDYAAARLGGNVTLGENVVIDASAVTTPNAVLATGIAVAAGATPEVKAGAAVQAGDTLISSLTLGDGASVAVSGLPTGIFDAIADNTLALRTQEAKVTVGETVTYYNTLQEALAAAVTATSEPLVEALVDEIDCSGWTSCVFNSASKLITFEGNGVTLTNLDAPLVNKSGSGAKGIVVKNVTVKDANIQTTDNYAAVFLPYADCVGTIYFENCHIVDSTVTGNKQLGGFVGFNSGYNNLSDGPLFNNVTITNCSVTGSTFTSNEGSVGALVGHAAANPWSKVGIFDTVVSNNTISCNENIKAGSVIGTIGCAGEENNGKTGGVTVSADVGGNTVSANGVATDRIFGRIGSTGGAVAVTGGTYDGTATYANDSYDSNNGKIIVSGGTFQTQPSQDAIADGFVAELSQDVNGWWTVGGPFVAKIGNVGYATLADALAAVQSGETIELLADIEWDGTGDYYSLDVAGAVTIDGAGHTISAPAENGPSNAAFLLGNTSATAKGSGDYTLKDITFSGFTTPAGVLRVQGAKVTVEGCTFTGNNATGGLFSIISSNYAEVTVDGCTFENNRSACAMVDIGNNMGDAGTATGEATVIKNSLFTGNTATVAEIFVGIGQGKTTVDSNTFSQNSDGIAVVYASNSADITGNFFDRNAITGTGANMVTVLAGPYGYSGERTVNVKDNAFVGNTKANGSTADVFLEDQSAGGTVTGYDISGNYWGDGEAPVAGVDYVAQREIELSTYATAYAANAEGYGVGVTESAAAIAQIVRNNAVVGYYWTLASAIAAAQEGDTVEILAAEISEGSVTFPAMLKNVTIKAADGVAATLKDMTLNSATGSAVDYEGITIDGLVFDNSRLLFTGQRTGEVVYKDWTIANCTFTNIVSGTTAAVHFGSFKAGETMDGLTFTNNVIDGVSGGSRSGLLVSRMSGDVLIEGNLITNVAWNAIQLLNAPEGSTVTITNNLLSSKAEEGVVNLSGNKAAMAISGNAIIGDGAGVANVAYLSTAVDVAGNCWGGGEPALSGTQEGGSILCANYYASYSYDEATRVLTFGDEVGAVAVVKTGDTLKGTYYSLAAAVAAAASGDTVELLADTAIETTLNLKSGVTLDGANHTISPANRSHFTPDGYHDGYNMLSVEGGVTGVTIKNVTVTSFNAAENKEMAPRHLISVSGQATVQDVTLHQYTTGYERNATSGKRGADALQTNGDCTIAGALSIAVGENVWSPISLNSDSAQNVVRFADGASLTITEDLRPAPQQATLRTHGYANAKVEGADKVGFVPVLGAVLGTYNNISGYESATSAKVGNATAAGTLFNYKVGDTYYTTFALAASVAVDTENAVENFADPAESDSYALANGSTLKVTKNGHEPAVVTTEGGEYVIYENTAETLTTYTTATAIAKIGDTYYSTFDEVLAVVAEAEQAGEPDPTIIVLADPQTTQPPTGWTFVTDEATPPVTTLQRAVAQNQTTGKQYATIQAAIDDASAEDTVEVLRNVTLAEGLEITQSITLTGAVNDDGTPKYTVTGPADLTSASSPVAGDIFVADDDGAVVVTISNLKLDGFGKDVASDGSASVVSFYAYEEGSALTVENVEFSNYSAFAVATVGSDGLLTVKDCAMEGAGGVLAEGADAKVVGGTMTGVAEGVVAESGASVEIDGLAVSVATDGKSVVVDAQSKATIADGVFAGKMLAGGLDVSQQGKGADLSISGGVFENYVYEEYCAADHVAVDYAGDVAAYAGWYQVVPGSYVASVTHEGAVKYYASLESAIAAAQSGDTVTLLADVELADRIWMKSGVTLDGDGHSIKPDATSAKFNDPRLASDKDYAASSSLSVINLANGVTDVTIKNVTVDSNGVYPRALIGTGTGSTITLEGVTLNHTSTTIRGADALALNGDCTIKGDFTVALGERSWSAISFNTTNENLDLSDCTSFTVTADVRTGTQPLVFTWNSAGSTVTGADAAGLVSVNGAANLTGFESVAASDKLGSAAAPSTYNFKVGNAYYTTFALAAPVAVDTENAVENFADPEAAYTLAQGSTLKVAKNGHEPTIQTDGGAYVIAEATTGDVTTYSTETAAVSVTDGADTAYFTTLEEAFGIVEDGDTVTLLANVTLTADVAATPAANANVTLVQGNYAITADSHAIALSGSPLLVVTTDKQTDAFDAAAGYVIVESGSYVYTPTKIVAMIGETPYTTFADAVEAVQDGETITVVGYNDTMVAPEGWKFVTDTSGEQPVTTLVKTDPNVSVTDGTTTKTYETLQQALNAAHEMSGDVTVTMLTDLAEYAVIHQKAGLNVTIDGQDKTLAGQIIIDGDGRNAGTETLTIQNVKFEDDKSHFYTGTDAFILVPSTKVNGTPYYTGKFNYAHNVTVTDCSFTSTSASLDVVGYKATSGATQYNMKMANVTGTNLHSLAQLTATEGSEFDNCTVTASDSFINIDGGGQQHVIKNCSFTSVSSDGYGVREKGSSSAVITLENNSFKTAKVFQLGKNDAPSGTIKVVSGTYDGGIVLSMSASGTAKYEISGGYFPTAVLPEYCAPNYVPVDAEEGAPLPYTVVEVVAEFRYPIEGTSGIPVTTGWFTNYLSSIYGSDPTAPVRTSMTNELVQALSADGANGMPLWQSYVLGLDPTSAADAFRLTATATGATAVTISVPAIDTAKFPQPAGTTVTFRLASRNADGTWTDIVSDAAEPVFEKSLDEVAGQVLRIFADIVTE